MKKILFVANVAKEHILKFHIPTIKALKNAGWQVDVACSGDDDVPFCDTQFKTCWKRSPFTPKTFAGIKELKGIIENGHYDVIYCHTPVGGMVARLAARKARKNGTKVVYFAHGLHFFKGAPLINWLLYYPIEKFLSFFTDDIILINQEDLDLTKKKFKTCKSHYLNGIGVDLDRLNIENPEDVRKAYRDELNIPQDATVLIYCAELLENKNQPYLMRVLKIILEKKPDTYLLLPGFNHSGDSFENTAKELGVYDNIRFLGWREDIAQLYTSSDICTPTSIREGFGINLVEAMYLHLPVVATNNRGHRTIIRDGENGFLVDLDNEKLFAQRVLELINNKALYDEITKTAYSEHKKYTSEEVITDLIKILD